jgi:hypothetical protein
MRRCTCSAKYEPTERAVVWRLRRFPGGEEFSLGGEVELIMSTKQKPWVRPPINVDFQVMSLSLPSSLPPSLSPSLSPSLFLHYFSVSPTREIIVSSAFQFPVCPTTFDRAGTHVHRIGAARALAQGAAAEGTVRHNQVGALHHARGPVSNPHLVAGV